MTKTSLVVYYKSWAAAVQFWRRPTPKHKHAVAIRRSERLSKAPYDLRAWLPRFDVWLGVKLACLLHLFTTYTDIGVLYHDGVFTFSTLVGFIGIVGVFIAARWSRPFCMLPFGAYLMYVIFHYSMQILNPVDFLKPIERKIICYEYFLTCGDYRIKEKDDECMYADNMDVEDVIMKREYRARAVSIVLTCLHLFFLYFTIVAFRRLRSDQEELIFIENIATRRKGSRTNSQPRLNKPPVNNAKKKPTNEQSESGRIYLWMRNIALCVLDFPPPYAHLQTLRPQPSTTKITVTKSRVESESQSVALAQVTRPNPIVFKPIRFLYDKTSDTLQLELNIIGGPKQGQKSILAEVVFQTLKGRFADSRTTSASSIVLLNPWLRLFTGISPEINPTTGFKVLLISVFSTTDLLQKPQPQLLFKRSTENPSKELFIEQINEFLIVKISDSIGGSGFLWFSFKSNHRKRLRMQFRPGDSAQFRRDYYAAARKFDASAGYRCESCLKTVQNWPKICRICLRLKAVEYCIIHPEDTVLRGFKTHFCSKRCLKDNWDRHKLLHAEILL